MGGGGGGGVITKYSSGGQVHVCICGILDIYKTCSTVIIEVHADMYMECRGVYIYVCMKLGGSGGMPPQRKFEFSG